MNARWWLAWFLAFGAAQAAAPAPLKLPGTQGEIRAFLRETGDPICVRCGVVTSARQLEQAGAQVTAPPLPGSSDSLDSGIGTVPFGTDRAKYERERLRQGPRPRYEVIVRYDDGSFGRVELAHDPRLKRGDRVQVEGGSVKRYP